MQGCETFRVLHINPKFKTIFLYIFSLFSLFGMFKKSNEASLSILEASHGKGSEPLSITEFEDVEFSPIALEQLRECADVIILHGSVNLCNNFQNLLVDGNLLFWHLSRFIKDSSLGSTLDLLQLIFLKDLVDSSPFLCQKWAA